MEDKKSQITDQKQTWNRIAEEWFAFKKNPSESVLNFLKNKSGRVLDLGCGAGRHLIKSGEYKMYLVDFSEEMIRLAEKKAKKSKLYSNTNFFVSDLTDLPFKENFFDCAIAIASIHCIEGFQKRKKSIEELFRVLKPDSEALIAVWNKDSKRFKNAQREKYVKWTDKGKRYYYLFEEKEIHDLFKKAGFKIKKKLDSRVNIIFIAEKSKKAKFPASAGNN